MSWVRSRFKYACIDAGQYGINVSAEDYVASGRRLIRTSDIDDTGVLRGESDAVYVDETVDSRHDLRVGDLLLSRSGTVGRALLVSSLPSPSTYAGYLVRFRPRPGVDPGFLRFVAESANFRAAIAADSITSTIQNFNAERYSNIAIDLPDYEEQRRISCYLDREVTRIDAVRRARADQHRALSARLSAKREEIFAGDVVRERISLKYLTDQRRPVVYGIVQAGPHVDDGVPYIKTGDLPELSPDRLSRTAWEIHRQYSRSVLRPQDIVMAMRASIGAVAMIPSNLPEANLTQGTARIAAAAGIDPERLFQAVQTKVTQDECRMRAVGTTFLTLNIWDLRRVTVPLLPKGFRAKAVLEYREAAAETAGLLASMRRQDLTLAERRLALITAAVSGKIDVSTASGAAV